MTTSNTIKVPVIGTDKVNVLIGTDLSDTISGGQGTDLIYGGAGADYLSGGAGKDVLFGGTGKDYLYGGSGADTFVYTAASDAGRGASADVIGDFKTGVDHLDLSAFMAGGRFIGSADFTIGGGPAVRYTASNGVLRGDLNGDGKVDFSIVPANHAHIIDTDFIF